MAKIKKKNFLKEFWSRNIAKGSFPIYFVATLVVLQTLGLIVLFSASYATAYIESSDSYSYISSQFTWALFGFFVMFLFAFWDYRFYARFIIPGYIACIALLLIVHFTCDPLNGDTRWLYWQGVPFPSIQVSEIVKFELILLSSLMICNFKDSGKYNMKALVYIILAIFPIYILLYFQPHISAIVLITMIIGSIILVAGVGGKWLLSLVVVAVGSVPFILQGINKLADWGAKLASQNADTNEALSAVLKGIDRINTRLGEWTLDVSQMGWQTKQSVYAIGSGGLDGLGLGQGVQKQLWLPEATNDFVFSVLCEELGFIGAMIVLILFVALIAQGIFIALEAADLFGTLVAIGITAQIAWQFFFNIGVVTGLLPNTGISLPFFSSGGSSLLMLLAQMGVLISISRIGTAKKMQERQTELEKMKLEKIKT